MESSACRVVRASALAGRVPSASPRGAAAARASEEEDKGREEGALVEASETSEAEEDNLSDGCCGGSGGAEKPCSCTNDAEEAVLGRGRKAFSPVILLLQVCLQLDILCITSDQMAALRVGFPTI